MSPVWGLFYISINSCHSAGATLALGASLRFSFLIRMYLFSP